MKLLYSPTSPYVRKVRVVLREKGLANEIQEVKCIPFDKEAALLAANPLGKVPALILANEQALFDSPVICEYLDTLAAEPVLFPTSIQRWDVLRAQALADGIYDAAVAIVLEHRRLESEQSITAIQHWQTQILMAVTSIDETLAALSQTINIGHIALAVALSYLDFRHAGLGWREKTSNTVTAWHRDFCQRQSMLDTALPV